MSKVLKTEALIKANITRLYDEFSNQKTFGYGDIMVVLGIIERLTAALIGRMYELELTECITGTGKGKYRFMA